PVDAATRVRRHIEASIETKRALLEGGTEAILKAAEVVAECLAAGHKIMLCGNGGSAGDAQDIAAEFVGPLDQDFPRPALPAIALTTDTSVLTANANDFGFATVFERQVQALGQPGDVLIGISTSGNSENVLQAIRYAREHGMRTLAFTSATGGKLAEAAET